MLLLCLVRPMLVPTEELKVHIAAPLHLHSHLLFIYPGECLLNLALGKLPAYAFVDCVMHCMHAQGGQRVPTASAKYERLRTLSFRVANP